MAYSTLRTFVNYVGAVYNASKTKRIFAEDLNLIGSNLEDHEERLGAVSGRISIGPTPPETANDGDIWFELT